MPEKEYPYMGLVREVDFYYKGLRENAPAVARQMNLIAQEVIHGGRNLPYALITSWNVEDQIWAKHLELSLNQFLQPIPPTVAYALPFSEVRGTPQETVLAGAIEPLPYKSYFLAFSGKDFSGRSEAFIPKLVQALGSLNLPILGVTIPTKEKSDFMRALEMNIKNTPILFGEVKQ